MKQVKPYDPWFGEFMEVLRGRMEMEGSEFGTGLMLFSLAVGIRAKRMLEIGRNRGFSTFALASALRFNEMGWDEVEGAKQRPDMDYPSFERPVKGTLTSIEPFPQQVAYDLIEKYSLTKYVDYVNDFSYNYTPSGEYDFIFIDGDHTYDGCLRDVQQYTPYVRPNGLWILHDYWGWFSYGKNNSPVKQVIEEHCQGWRQVLVDTGYMGFVVFQREKPETVTEEILKFD